jgi:phenylalanyl-tRNA synthetase beta chain
MKLPLSWLGEFVDLSGITGQEVAECLAASTFAVEKIEKVGPELTGPIVVGRILEIYPHPNADRIRLTKTKVDENAEPLEIVCGAHNIEVGQIVPVALPGAKVVNRHDGTELVIKLSKIRGVQSNGMLCSPSELGITDGGGDGILILPDDGQLKLGSDVKELLAPHRDETLDIICRSSRENPVLVSDVAGEISALLKRTLKAHSWESDFQASEGGSYQIKIDNFADCPLYIIRSLSNLKVSASPLLIKRRIEALGLQPVNNIVDIVHSVIFEYGQLLRPYDAALIDGQKIQVRRAVDEEAFKTIDGTEYSLNPETLLVSDGRGSISIAGVMGSITAATSEKTTNVALEAAYFEADRMQRGKERLGLSSTTSRQFASEPDLSKLKVASNRVAYLMLKHCSAGGAGQASAFSIAERQLVQ